ncbi:hypothetical protein CMESO_248 (nucleomorph) [Chroomonas mesostigmatica CCMP1168]|uniref:Uncharacterized protein n=1 Tax=Chroomonas mesostigmatica CCMP1168 TaxID=1195612 RepID=J7G5R6_9CRYP|nr:hypothetical protein CMESO_248 [Chroomonas mesostigmatica CCMP1168]
MYLNKTRIFFFYFTSFGKLDQKKNFDLEKINCIRIKHEKNIQFFKNDFFKVPKKFLFFFKIFNIKIFCQIGFFIFLFYIFCNYKKFKIIFQYKKKIIFIFYLNFKIKKKNGHLQEKKITQRNTYLGYLLTFLISLIKKFFKFVSKKILLFYLADFSFLLFIIKTIFLIPKTKEKKKNSNILLKKTTFFKNKLNFQIKEFLIGQSFFFFSKSEKKK